MGTGGKIIMESNLFTLRRQLEIARGEECTWATIAAGAGLHPHTVYDLAANRSKRVEMETLAKLLNFFRDEGLNVGPGDLFVTRPEGKGE